MSAHVMNLGKGPETGPSWKLGHFHDPRDVLCTFRKTCWPRAGKPGRFVSYWYIAGLVGESGQGMKTRTLSYPQAKVDVEGKPDAIA